ncbi:unnamed protein product [Lota lota]
MCYLQDKYNSMDIRKYGNVLGKRWAEDQNDRLVQSAVGKQLKRSGAGGGKRKSVLRNVHILGDLGTSIPLL